MQALGFRRSLFAGRGLTAARAHAGLGLALRHSPKASHGAPSPVRLSTSAAAASGSQGEQSRQAGEGGRAGGRQGAGSSVGFRERGGSGAGGAHVRGGWRGPRGESRERWAAGGEGAKDARSGVHGVAGGGIGAEGERARSGGRGGGRVDTWGESRGGRVDRGMGNGRRGSDSGLRGEDERSGADRWREGGGGRWRGSAQEARGGASGAPAWARGAHLPRGNGDAFRSADDVELYDSPAMQGGGARFPWEEGAERGEGWGHGGEGRRGEGRDDDSGRAARARVGAEDGWRGVAGGEQQGEEFPWLGRGRGGGAGGGVQGEAVGVRERRVRQAWVAEVSLPPSELRRLRAAVMVLRQPVKVGRQGVTDGIVAAVQARWRAGHEVVKVRCEGAPAFNMRHTHEQIERLTGGMVVWRAGAALAVYRGPQYGQGGEGQRAQGQRGEGQVGEVGDAAEAGLEEMGSDGARVWGEGEMSDGEVEGEGEGRQGEQQEAALVSGASGGEGQQEWGGQGGEGGVSAAAAAGEEDVTLGLGPKVAGWERAGHAPVDADLLLGGAAAVGYRAPFRLVPYGVSSKLSNDDMTRLRHLARKLPPHFMLGRNKGLEGLAAAVVALWECSEVAKIGVKRGVQNTSNERMAEELKRLTGGVLLARDKFFISLYRGKDFLPAALASTLAARQHHARQSADEEERERLLALPSLLLPSPSGSAHGEGGAWGASAGSARRTEGEGDTEGTQGAESAEEEVEGQLVEEERRRRRESIEASRRLALARQIEQKLAQALRKKGRAEEQLEKLQAVLRPVEVPADSETLTEEERHMFRKLGQKMRAYLEMGKRGVFAGLVENMHLHWKHRELVKIICKERDRRRAEDVAGMLAVESGGVLVDVVAVKKYHAIIVYRGKNYSRPSVLRPKGLLTKRQALKRATEEQRRASLEAHMRDLDTAISRLSQGLAEAEKGVQVKPGEIAPLSRASLPSSPLSLDSATSTGSSASGSSSTGRDTWEEGSEAGVGGPSPLSPAAEAEAAEIDALIAASMQPQLQQQEQEEERQRQQREREAVRETRRVGREEVRERALVGPLFRAPPLSRSQRLDLRRRALTLDSTAAFQVGQCTHHPCRPSLALPPLGSPSLALTCNHPPAVFLSSSTLSLSSPFCVICRIPSTLSLSSPFCVICRIPSTCNCACMCVVPLTFACLHVHGVSLCMVPLAGMATGRSNVVEGLARAIRLHFTRHALVKVGIRGRAAGTPAQEIVKQLEVSHGAGGMAGCALAASRVCAVACLCLIRASVALTGVACAVWRAQEATGGVFVSQEPSKVVLYRGWEDGQPAPWEASCDAGDTADGGRHAERGWQ
ncbi:unnamed protein product [Closterium sp. Naga37s-1]|nr:unnamed protein product [Closterium sp. Naga37s-1]